ncbi:hypothetical protein BDY17DRAFT_110819 [Neohortaea acidophila]|uniref:Cobalamin-independent methionine synthase MetE C-terminal/archaeal domain-containing protein n=1 Tax=Neohortaea acidophila TaxID=245834 RepID=A0A6A6Q169_9PEZI|nr:uncharacterized protein BDY17DRAFT_110819 [Neohortaea acidophila]KAF2485736.1 hypothetical protein BDY17DRAFT_110819 [Neohortaea acidophila]
MAPPFRADQVGSFLRPQELLDARSNLASAKNIYAITDDDPRIKAAEEKAIAWAVQKQRELSIRPYCSGEYNRHIFYGGFFEKLEGMTTMPELPILAAFRTDFPTTTKLAEMGAKTRAAVVCTGPIRWKASAYMDEWKTLRSNLSREEWAQAKITIPSPSYQHIQLAPGTAFTKDSGYTNDKQYFQDLGHAYAAEIQALYDEGVRNIQIDDPNLTYFCSSQFLTGCEKDGTDAEALLDSYLAAHNVFLKTVPPDLHIGVHLCRGNMAGSVHWVTGSYEHIAQKLFHHTLYPTYYLEFDDAARQGDFAPLRFLPRGKNVVLGIVSTKRPELEKMEELRAAVREAAEVIAAAQGVEPSVAAGCLALSPQCGFSSSSLAGGKGMTMEGMWEKLVLVRDAARGIWGDHGAV